MIEDIYLDWCHAPFNKNYIKRITQTIANALSEYPRTMVVRVDFHLPDYFDIDDSILCEPNLAQGLMSRMVESLNAKIEAFYRRKIKQGIKTYPCRARLIWVREVSELNKSHYHAALLFNKDTFKGLGRFNEGGTGLGSLIQDAWLSALRLSKETDVLHLAQFPKNPLYFLDINAGIEQFKDAYDSLTFRLSYMAKERTKRYSRSERSFGCSQY
jgi:hypothetical protein